MNTKNLKDLTNAQLTLLKVLEIKKNIGDSANVSRLYDLLIKIEQKILEFEVNNVKN